MEEGAGTRQQWQSRAASPQLTGRHAYSSLVPGRMSPTMFLLSGKHPGEEAELPHSLFWAAFPPPPPPRVPHSYCLCRNSVAINPPLPTGTARLFFPASSPPPSRAVCVPQHCKKTLGSSFCLAEERRGTVLEVKPQHPQPSRPTWRWAGGSYERSTSSLTWGRTGAGHPHS